MRCGFCSLSRVSAVSACVGVAVALASMSAHSFARSSIQPGAAVSCRPGNLKPEARNPAQAQAQTKLAHSVSTADACRLVPGIKVQSLGSLWASLMGDSSIGGKRFDTPVPPGAPTGTVMMGPQGVVFDFDAIAGERLTSFQLVDRTLSHPLAQVSSPRARFNLTNLDRTHRYSWRLVTSAQVYQAQFGLLDAADETAVEDRLRTVDKAGLDPMTAAFYKAAVFDDEGLYADRDALLQHLRQEMARGT